VQEATDGIATENAKRHVQDEQHDGVIDDLGQDAGGVVLAAGEGSLDATALVTRF
jgi:hypothetical protein